ncbi:DUF4381 domain-containing protein [Paracoccus aestuariivivens]|uniref:DUF4381 family protein n=1 Tax=Paracoccus aestuariivivens TaxID=1820333 RepID=A0A6L6J590_9RHOB|nr:DUF4381 domain-containing protein [Paracoccus aestuariivivens]MTH77060.1 DUF4381 family protein [Paracoccus aestuariivivens]
MEPTNVDNDSLIGLIEQLTDPVEPTPISMVPQTWGWAVVAAVLLLALAYGFWRWRRHRRANAYRRAALDLLAEAKDDPVRIAEILRRTALAAYPRSDVAGLAGQSWLAFLDHQVGGQAFASGPGQVLASAPYRESRPDPALTHLAETWVRQHRRAEA